MKRILSLLCLFIFGITICVPFLSGTKSIKTQTTAVTNSEEVEFDEDKLTDKQTIVSTNYDELSGYLKEKATKNNNPFDTKQNKMMQGASITPTASNIGEVSSTFPVNEFVIDKNSSIYLWIFIPDENYYSLEIKFQTTMGDYISWNFNILRLIELISATTGSSQIQYGWKLFELNLSDAIVSFDIEDIDSYTFSQMQISYTDSLNQNKKVSSNTLSFYNVYMATSFGGKSNIVKVQNYSYYKFKPEFKNMFDSLYVGDKYTFSSIENIFEYVYVGKFDLKNEVKNNYTWQTTFKRPNEEGDSINFGSEYTFQKEGFYSIGVTIKEYRKDTDYKQVLSATISTYCSEFNLGSFDNVSYELEKGQRISFNFNIVKDFVFDGEIEVKVSNENVAEITYYVSHNTCQIQLLGKKKGTVTISVSASGHRVGETKSQEFQVNTTAKIEDSNSFHNVEIIILWVTLGLYLIGMLIYVIIAVVNHKKRGIR